MSRCRFVPREELLRRGFDDVAISSVRWHASGSRGAYVVALPCGTASAYSWQNKSKFTSLLFLFLRLPFSLLLLAVGQDGFAAIEASSRLLIKFFLYSILTCFCACGFGGALRFFCQVVLSRIVAFLLFPLFVLAFAFTLLWGSHRSFIVQLFCLVLRATAQLRCVRERSCRG